MPEDEPFEVVTENGVAAGNTLIVGQPTPGMAGVTAVDYLIRESETDRLGHVVPGDLPAIAPFEDGVPRHHSRLYAMADADVSVLFEELFVPPGAARGYVDAVVDWASEVGVGEVAVLHGVPYPHAPEEHDVFYVATEEYRDRRLAEGTVEPLKGGYLDGVPGEFVTHGLDGTGPDVGVYVTPSHPPGPDVEAALRLLDAIQRVHGFEVDETELRELGEQYREYYERLAERATAAQEEGGLSGYPEDRMYM